MWPFNTGDCLTEVTTWEGLTVSESIILRKQEKTLWKRWPLNTGDHLDKFDYIRIGKLRKQGKTLSYLMHAMNIKKPAALHAQVGNFVTWVWNNQCLRNDALWQRTRNVDFISC